MSSRAPTAATDPRELSAEDWARMNRTEFTEAMRTINNPPKAA